MLNSAMAHEVTNLHSRDANLEEIFLAYYRGDTNDSTAAPARTALIYAGAATAGEEQARTLGLVLSTGVGRTSFLAPRPRP